MSFAGEVEDKHGVEAGAQTSPASPSSPTTSTTSPDAVPTPPPDAQTSLHRGGGGDGEGGWRPPRPPLSPSLLLFFQRPVLPGDDPQGRHPPPGLAREDKGKERKSEKAVNKILKCRCIHALLYVGSIKFTPFIPPFPRSFVFPAKAHTNTT